MKKGGFQGSIYRSTKINRINETYLNCRKQYDSIS